MTKPTGHVSHVFSPGTDNALLDEARAAHEAGRGPSIGTTLVEPNGAQLQQVPARPRQFQAMIWLACIVTLGLGASLRLLAFSPFSLFLLEGLQLVVVVLEG